VSLNVKLDLPDEVEEKLRRENGNIDSEVKEACAVELFRRDKLTHYELHWH
jgi:predicted HTH domain antitoxin